ncbi:Radical SAM domain protein [Solidesulfovibrio fructosivorans JJ]]|uniref:Radical SAM domain protein n=1 Tax=Solidesulfovibrio fructosivorans JJ] TaxID=596151 RepID=E1JXW0_SOLFR|nr:radical SAM protein [Solidesulfovibrio fructosivorans]EFL50883.1 Radical SAM domain protein [Solidesulfovibrio fructosivorans JJ]]
MKVLLLNVPDAHVGKTTDDWDLEATDIGVFPPMGILYLAGVLRAGGRHDIGLVDCILDRLTPDAAARRAADFDPDVVGLTVYTPTLYDALILTRRLRELAPRAKIVWGGPHTSLFPDESMAQPEVDFLVTGEAEESFPAFLDALEEGRSFEDIPGIYWREAGAVRRSGDPGYVKDIESIPFPAYDLLPYKRYFSAIGTGLPVGTICSSRGCPFHCTFCCKPYSTYRSRSVDNILDEMAVYYERGIREFFFFDDLFNASAKRVAAISQGILDRGFRVVWAFRGRVDAVTEDMLRLAKKSGCRQALFGVEDATDEGLKRINKKITVEQVRRAIKLCRKVGILTSTNWIIGFPHHKTQEDILHLIDTAVSIDSDFAQFNIMIAYYGTAIFQEGVDKGLFPADIWRAHAANPVPNFVEPIWEEHLSRAELSKLLKLCYRRFYFRPLPILRKFLRVRRASELALFAKGALTLLGIKGYHRKRHKEGESQFAEPAKPQEQ